MDGRSRSMAMLALSRFFRKIDLNSYWATRLSPGRSPTIIIQLGESWWRKVRARLYFPLEDYLADHLVQVVHYSVVPPPKLLESIETYVGEFVKGRRLRGSKNFLRLFRSKKGWVIFREVVCHGKSWWNEKVLCSADGEILLGKKKKKSSTKCKKRGDRKTLFKNEAVTAKV